MIGKKTGGRKKGTPNQDNAKIKEAFHLLIESNTGNMTDWLSRVASTDPKGALTILLGLAEYILPKQSRVESEGTREHNHTIVLTRDAKQEDILNKL